jgi:hypothetical protein
MSARTDLSGGYQADWYPYRDPPKANASEFYPNHQPNDHVADTIDNLTNRGARQPW